MRASIPEERGIRTFQESLYPRITFRCFLKNFGHELEGRSGRYGVGSGREKTFFLCGCRRSELLACANRSVFIHSGVVVTSDYLEGIRRTQMALRTRMVKQLSSPGIVSEQTA